MLNAEASLSRTPAPYLPTGACNFIDLTPGASASKCGCRRFWASPTQAASAEHSAWCMCKHHACYHDEGPRSTQQSWQQPQQPQQPEHQHHHFNNPGHHQRQRSDDEAVAARSVRATRESMSPLRDLRSPTIQPMLHRLNEPAGPNPGQSQMSYLRRSREAAVPAVPGFLDRAESYLLTPSPPAAQPTPFPGHNHHDQQFMPDTLTWINDAQSPSKFFNSPLPPIPPQCLMPSQATSTTSSMRLKYYRPFAGKGLDTLSAPVPGMQPLTTLRAGSMPPRPTPVFQRDATPKPTSLFQRDTTPGPAPRLQQDAAPADGGALPIAPHLEEIPPRPGSAATQIEPRAAPGNFVQEEMATLKGLIDTQAQRLDRMEADCFSDCPDRHEQADLRITDLESRMEEVEQLNLAYTECQNHSRGRQDDAVSSISAASVDSSASRRGDGGGHWQDMDERLQSLESRVTRLQSIAPSVGHAWEVEVVFLPFALRRVWQLSHDFKDPYPGADDDWNRMLQPQDAVAPRSRSASIIGACRASSTPAQTTPVRMTPARMPRQERHEHEWLFARAFSEDTATDLRLKSRGLIQTISVTGPDARSVQTAMRRAFEAVFRNTQMHTRAVPGGDPRAAEYLGLRSDWVPLRKIHKDSRLRFLSPGEMLTPELWTVPFLSSVMMRAARPRLFVTHPDAYLQDEDAFKTGWTWSKLKEAPHVSWLDSTESQQVSSEANEAEKCWDWIEFLDGAGGTAVTPRSLPSPQVTRTRGQSQTSPIPSFQDRRASERRMTPRTHEAAGRGAIAISSKRSQSYSSSSVGTPMDRQRVAKNGITKRQYTPSSTMAPFTPKYTVSPSPRPSLVPNDPNARPSWRHATPRQFNTPSSHVLLPVEPVMSSVPRYTTGPGSSTQGDEDEDMTMDGDNEDDGDERMTIDDEEDADDAASEARRDSASWHGIEEGPPDGEDVVFRPETLQEVLDLEGGTEGADSDSSPSEYSSKRQSTSPRR